MGAKKAEKAHWDALKLFLCRFSHFGTREGDHVYIRTQSSIWQVLVLSNYIPRINLLCITQPPNKESFLL